MKFFLIFFLFHSPNDFEYPECYESTFQHIKSELKTEEHKNFCVVPSDVQSKNSTQRSNVKRRVLSKCLCAIISIECTSSKMLMWTVFFSSLFVAFSESTGHGSVQFLLTGISPLRRMLSSTLRMIQCCGEIPEERNFTWNVQRAINTCFQCWGCEGIFVYIFSYNNFKGLSCVWLFMHLKTFQEDLF